MTKPTKQRALLERVLAYLRTASEMDPHRFRLHDDATWYHGIVNNDEGGYYALGDASGHRFRAYEIAEIERVSDRDNYLNALEEIG